MNFFEFPQYRTNRLNFHAGNRERNWEIYNLRMKSYEPSGVIKRVMNLSCRGVGERYGIGAQRVNQIEWIAHRIMYERARRRYRLKKNPLPYVDRSRPIDMGGPRGVLLSWFQ